MSALKELIKQERYEEASEMLRGLAFNAGSYAEFNRLCRIWEQLSTRCRSTGRTAVKVALLGLGTVKLIESALGLALETVGLKSEIRTADYNTYAQEMLDTNSDTARFRPDVSVVVNSPMQLPSRPSSFDSRERVNSLVNDVTDQWLGLCSQLHENAGCEVILDNFHMVDPSSLGNYAVKAHWDLNTFLRRVNLEIGSRAPSFVHINDVDMLASRLGVDRWFDSRYWYHAKVPMSLECIPAYVKSISGIFSAIYGRTAKCLVLDLDNTLWGGIVGDDGVGGIKIGQGDALGEAFLAFQHYLLNLRERGIMLAVCSKNDESNALAPFVHRPEMAIKRSDVVAFKANWAPKPDNLQAIARELNIGLDAMVFVDDNPREREHVRQTLPEVRVVELSDDAADYPRLLAGTGWFEVVRLSAEDRRRTEEYQANALRSGSLQSATSYSGYLTSLEQVAVIAPYKQRHLERIAQLINKTNQFNLTTRRQTLAEVEQEMTDRHRLTACVRLTDRFGDNGLISVLSARLDNRELHIDQWLMSCRVFNRGVEHLLFNWVVDRAHKFGADTIRGTYIPTPKNQLAAGLYASLGFSRLHTEVAPNDSVTHWRLPLPSFVALEVNISLVDDY